MAKKKATAKRKKILPDKVVIKRGARSKNLEIRRMQDQLEVMQASLQRFDAELQRLERALRLARIVSDIIER